MARRLPPSRRPPKRGPAAPPPFVLPSVEDGVAQVEEFVAEILGTGVGTLNDNPVINGSNERTRVIRFDFAGNGAQYWTVDHNCVVVGFTATSGSSGWQLAGHNPDPINLVDGINIGRHVIEGSGSQNFSGIRIPFNVGDTMWIRNGTATTLTVSVFVNNVG